MGLLPTTVCRRCHRQYPAIRGRCPYCGTRKSREVRRAVPESDSAVKGSDAARRTRENVNWQLLIGAILIVCVVAVVITIISVNIQGRIDETKAVEAEVVPEAPPEATAVPTPTPTPPPTPSPTPPVTSVVITFYGSEMTGFAEDVGDVIDLDATAYPISENVQIEWSSSDESVATVDEEGRVTLVGSGYCVIYARAGGMEAKCEVWVK